MRVPTLRSYPKRWTAYEVRALMEASPVLSPSSRRHDLITKRRFFQRVAVPDYWTVDLERRLVQRWRPRQERPDTADSTLVWHPTGADEPIAIDLAALSRALIA